jgi:signal recognition particle GTPase
MNKELKQMEEEIKSLIETTKDKPSLETEIKIMTTLLLRNGLLLEINQKLCQNILKEVKEIKENQKKKNWFQTQFNKIWR